MKQLDHLTEYILTITTKAPVFIGSGEIFGKKEYMFDAKKNIVSFIDKNRFFQLLIDNRLIDKYEKFVLSGKEGKLYYFLRTECKLSDENIQSIVFSRASAEDALDERHPLKEIHAFMRGVDGKAYIPGSSLKGCLRTVLLTSMLLQDDKKPNSFRKIEDVEEKYLHTLGNTRNSKDAINSIMQGVSISDSEPIDEKNMMLAVKIDSMIDGYENFVPVVRQCIKPETTVRFRLTLDQSILKNKLTRKEILSAIQSFDKFYMKKYTARFQVEQEIDASFKNDFIVLGGGSGFFGKNMIYPLYETDYVAALKRTAQNMQRDFKKHGHERDVKIGISPHSYKITEYGGEAYPFGVCRIDIT